ncbi:DUF4817 domain-containing protein [Trichonephila clavata]|uniref:DUF4817 domain-containing protein n=1 Tax=Trichonephila clavata TaxID=2740835 RepID=A0A8X6IDG0_TRICU|nr:DUF4817 domain-containing protein [Trichonephila clavata]
MWYAVTEFGVWGPYFFEEDKLTATSDRYCHMIETFRSKLNQFLGDHKEAEIWLQQDGAIAHTSRRLLGILRDLFLGHLLYLRGDIAPRSPDLPHCAFFSVRILKGASVQTSFYNPVRTKGANHPDSGCHSIGNDMKNYG